MQKSIIFTLPKKTVVKYDKPIPIKVEGVDIRTTIIDEEDGTVKHTLIIYNDQFINFSRMYADHKGITRMEIVKRRIPSPSGHEHWVRIASNKTNKCVVESIVPVAKPNELR